MSKSMMISIFFAMMFFFIISCSDSRDTDNKTELIVKTEPNLYIPTSDDKLSDVDYISLQPAIYNDTLRVQVNYICKEDDLIIEWSSGVVTCLYTIYKTDYLGSSEKIEEILSGEKILKRSDQAFYINTDNFENGNYYLIECVIDTGYIKLEPSGTFFYNKN